MSHTAYEPPVDRSLTLHLCLVLAFASAPHVLRMPIWISASMAGLIIWRALVCHQGWRLPPKWIRLLLAIFAFVVVTQSMGGINGQAAGTALLLMMMGVKLTEMESERDHRIVLILAYFIILTHYLWSQEIHVLIYTAIAIFLTTASLLELSHSHGALPLRQTIKTTGTLMLHALPVMLVLFVLFPRIPGPLWGLPSDSGASRSGLSDSMSPGSISSLIRSDQVAFRVRFEDKIPPNEQLYWRAHVFWRYVGLTWLDGEPNGTTRETPKFIGDPIRYEVTLEPNRQPWLMGLDIVAEGPPDALFSPAQQMWVKEPVKERRLYSAVSYTNYVISPQIKRITRYHALKLPNVGNARARALARSWREQGLNSEQIVSEALTMFRQQAFVYTLSPELIASDAVDGFLFDTREGFCEHYAGAFTFLMRAAGVPARIVTGYQGGEMNESGNYMIVRQSDAHAWSEVWLAGQGWVRVDPTAAVAPERIEFGLAAALPESEELPLSARRGNDLVHALQLQWDSINAGWNRWVLAYGPELQKDFLSRFGLGDWFRMTIALTIVLVSFLSILGIYVIWQSRPTINRDPLVKIWNQYCKKLAKAGLQKQPHEGPLDFAQRIKQARPDLAASVAEITKSYIALRYADRKHTVSMDRFRYQVRQFSV